MSLSEEQRYWLEGDFVLDLLKQLPTHVFWKNKDCVYLGCNDGFAKSLGLNSPEDIIGKTDYDLPTKAEESDGYRADDKLVMESRQPKLNIEEEQTFPDGRRVVLLTSKVPLLSREGDVIGVLGLYSDITELKKTQEDLRKAKDEAETAYKVKTEFIQNMQHDIRTPSSGLIGGMDMLLEEVAYVSQGLEASKFKRLNNLVLLISKAAHQIHEFLNDAIDFENIDYVTRPVQNRKINLAKIAQAIIDAEYLAAKSKKVNLSLFIDKDIPEIVKGDEYRVKRILLNLVSNAVKFTSEGSVQLSVRLQKSRSKNILVTFEVSDTGTGIQEDKLNSIFEIFTRLNPSNEGTYRGSGIGLYRVKQFVDALKGEIDVESELGKGSSFYITLPFEEPLVSELITKRFQKGEDTLRKELSENHDALSTTKLPIRSLITDENHLHQAAIRVEVLLIEDDLLARIATQSRLTTAGCNVTMATNMKEGLEKLAERTYDVVISDLGLPDGSGINIIHEIKNNRKAPNYRTPFVALTAHSDKEKQQSLHDSGFVLVLNKPFNDEKIELVFRECLKTA